MTEPVLLGILICWQYAEYHVSDKNVK